MGHCTSKNMDYSNAINEDDLITKMMNNNDMQKVNDFYKNRKDKTIIFHPSYKYIEKIKIPECIEHIEFIGDFDNKTKFESIKIPDNVQNITFSGNFDDSIYKLKFPENLQHLNIQCYNNGFQFFNYTKNLKYLSIMSETPQSLKNVNLPDSLEKIFIDSDNITDLDKIKMPESLKEIGLISPKLVKDIKDIHKYKILLNCAGCLNSDIEKLPDLENLDIFDPNEPIVNFPITLKKLTVRSNFEYVNKFKIPFGCEVIFNIYDFNKDTENKYREQILNADIPYKYTIVSEKIF